MISISYEIPHDAIIDNRNMFYSLHKESSESVEKWLDRVRSSADFCQFGTLRDFFLIDKFVCELASNEIQMLRKTGTWSLAEILDAVKNDGIFHVDENAESNLMDEIDNLYGSDDDTSYFEVSKVKIENVDDFDSMDYTNNFEDEDDPLNGLLPTFDNELESTEEIGKAPKEIQVEKKRATAFDDSKWLVKEKLTQNSTDRRPKMENEKSKRVIKYIMNDQSGVECKHLPIHDDRPNTSRCKLRGCHLKTSVMCEKCKMHLCFVKERNCFKKYHEEKNISVYHEIERDDEKLNPTRCKNRGCNLKTAVICKDCGLHLCFVKGRNCFHDFHTNQ